MCGIVGLFLKDKALEPRLGDLLSDMLITMTDRGPDSAGIAIYGGVDGKTAKVTIQSADPESDFTGLAEDLAKAGIDSEIELKSTHAVISIAASKLPEIRAALAEIRPNVRIMGSGESVEIFKEVGLPKDVVQRFGVRAMGGTHGIGHTRMATESAVTTLGAHPFSTGADQCLVHNGSLSNHNNLRRELIREGMAFETQNDSEVAAAYLTAEMAKGKDLGQALTGALDDLDGFFTFV
ncbi:MAG: glutamine amidotransferase, partial [Allorhizobium sp.]